MTTDSDFPLLEAAVPELAQIIRDSLSRHLGDATSWIQERDIVLIIEQLADLRMVERCCVSDFCASFYTIQRGSRRSFSRENGDRTIPLDGDSLNLDVVNDEIVYVEVLFRPAITKRVDVVLGRSPPKQRT